jgi:hypothetical protein
MTEIGAPMDHKENMYKNEVCIKKKVGGGRQQDLVRRKKKNINLRLNLSI